MLAPILKEGFTEYFTREVMRQNPNLGPMESNAYRRETQAASRIIFSTMSISVAAAAYFHGNSSAIDRVRDAIQNVEQHPDTFRVLENMRSPETERALREVRPAQQQSQTGENDRGIRTMEDIQEH